ncbi:hypothetical protein [Alloiococcus otitis]|uniref:hypothetical protein n=1 Tax=Alloiococcus otitis TaxID=1652 RepID=UPI0002F63BF5|nr:hypothetical protein [Alloiococcus otitis]
MAEGLGNIFSSQIDLGKSEFQARLLQDAEIKSLQAQVNPHFSLMPLIPSRPWLGWIVKRPGNF